MVKVPTLQLTIPGARDSIVLDPEANSQRRDVDIIPEETADAVDCKRTIDRRPSAGGTIRHDCSTAQLLSDDESLELRQWVARNEGPWKNDIERYPGPPSGTSEKGEP